MTQIVETESEIAAAIVGALSLKIDDSQYDLRTHLSSDQLTVYDWCQRGNRSLEIGGAINLEKARNEFSQALKIAQIRADSEFALLDYSTAE